MKNQMLVELADRLAGLSDGQSDAAVCPTQDEIQYLCEWMMLTLFPRHDRHSSENVYTALLRLQQLLTVACEKTVAPAEAEEMVGRWLQGLPAIKGMLLADAERAYRMDPIATGVHEVILTYPGFAATAIYRLAHSLYRLEVPLIPRMMTEYAHSKTGIDIHPAAEIGAELFIDHGTGIVIGGTTVIGSRVSLYQGVTLGTKKFRFDGDGLIVRTEKRHPTIEDDVVIYCGATILGGDTVIGSGAKIMAGAFVTESVPSGARVTRDWEN